MTEHHERMMDLPPALGDVAQRLARPVPVSPNLLPAVMTAVARRPLPRRAALHAILHRRWFRVSPLQLGLAAASLAIAGVALGRYTANHDSAAPSVLTVAVEVRPQSVRFVLNAPDVRHIALVGDFNGWRAQATPLVRDASTGLWTVDLPISSGRYSYAFVVDGRWTADPNSPRAPEDDFGRPNSVLVVHREASRT
jgi:hypothetical protein